MIPFRTGNLGVARLVAPRKGEPPPDPAIERAELPRWRALGFDAVDVHRPITEALAHVEQQLSSHQIQAIQELEPDGDQHQARNQPRQDDHPMTRG